jgi:uncharacterized membrane protein YbaN (DUF454 family)
MAAFFRHAAGFVLIGLGVAGLVLPVIPGIPLLAAGVAVLGTDHALVKGTRDWLKKRGWWWGKRDPGDS